VARGSLWANNGDDARSRRCKLLGHRPPRLRRAIKRTQVISVAKKAAGTCTGTYRDSTPRQTAGCCRDTFPGRSRGKITINSASSSATLCVHAVNHPRARFVAGKILLGASCSQRSSPLARRSEMYTAQFISRACFRRVRGMRDIY